MNGVHGGRLQPFWWDETAIRYIDQRQLPQAVVVATARTVNECIAAISTGGVCGMQSVDSFAAYGLALARDAADLTQTVEAAFSQLRAAAGPLNPCSAISRVGAAPSNIALSEADRCLDERRRIGDAIVRNAIALLPQAGSVLTHGNTGALANAGVGTALGAIFAAAGAGKRLDVFVSEGRPHLTGARITMFELARANVRATLFVDAAAAWILREQSISAVMVGAAGIAANGDLVGEIGTYGIALAAAQLGIPLYVATPRANVNSSLSCADARANAQGPSDEIRSFGGVPCACADAGVVNPSFDVTPGHLVTAIITEYGITRPPYHEALPVLSARPNFAFIGGSSQGLP